jgi:hypothetical protein
MAVAGQYWTLTNRQSHRTARLSLALQAGKVDHSLSKQLIPSPYMWGCFQPTLTLGKLPFGHSRCSLLNCIDFVLLHAILLLHRGISGSGNTGSGRKTSHLQFTGSSPTSGRFQKSGAAVVSGQMPRFSREANFLKDWVTGDPNRFHRFLGVGFLEDHAVGGVVSVQRPPRGETR